MNASRIYTILSVVGLLLTVVIILQKKVPQPEWQKFFTEGTLPPSLVPASSPRVAKIGESDSERDSVETPVTSLEPVGTELKDWNDLLSRTVAIPRLNEIPWERQEIELAQRAFRSGASRLLPAGEDVFPLPEELGEITNPIFSFRKSAVVVGLQVDPAAQQQLPKLSRGEIEGYLNKHALALQAMIYRNQQGDMTFAGPVDAAFTTKSTPGTTAVPEAMIKDAVQNIRLLGAIPNSTKVGDPTTRTLVLSFSYQRDLLDPGALRPTLVTDYELLFLHLVKDEAGLLKEPTIAAFATTEGRKNFIEIQPTGNAPNIMASIRFDEFKLMGLYPASPVVTGVRCQSRYSTKTEDIRARLRGGVDLPPISLGQLLDELHEGAAFAGSSQRPAMNFKK